MAINPYMIAQSKFVSELRKIPGLSEYRQTPENDTLHELMEKQYFYTLGAKTFEKLAEENIKAIANDLTFKQESAIIEAVDGAKANKLKVSEVIHKGPFFTYVFVANTPQTRFKKEKLYPVLGKKGWTKDMIDALVLECSETGEPSKSHQITFSEE